MVRILKAFTTEEIDLILKGVKTQFRQVKRPKFFTNDCIYVQEKWATLPERNGCPPSLLVPDDKIFYFPDGEGLKWRPSRILPYWACRTIIEVTDIRRQKLQNISKDDVLAEGVERKGVDCWVGSHHSDEDYPRLFCDAKGAFADLWDANRAKKEKVFWQTNPLVYAVSFRVVLRP